MRMKRGLMSIAVAGLAVALTGCGSSTPDSSSAASAPTSSSSMAPDMSTSPSAAPSAPAGKPVIITIKDFKYTVPASVAPGAKVTVKNEDSQNHTVTSAPKGAFNVTANAGGGTATFTAPTKPGTYKFTCDFHADMMGAVVVK